eukprot:756518-Hanusia_phi.AAC.2
MEGSRGRSARLMHMRSKAATALEEAGILKRVRGYRSRSEDGGREKRKGRGEDKKEVERRGEKERRREA